LGAFPKPTSFDDGLFKTVRFLKSCGYDYKLYNAHSPQIINKQLALQILLRTDGMELDEWSIYFNIAKHLQPNHFTDRPYRVIGWPGSSTSWLPSVISDNIIFENYYEHNDYSLPVDVRITKYLQSYTEAMGRKALVTPGDAILKVSKHGLNFNAEKITGPNDSRCEIVFEVELHKFSLNISFQSRNYTFDENSITRWFALNFSSIDKNKPANLDITVSIEGNTIDCLSIPIQILSV
jgi:hypothetical protein